MIVIISQQRWSFSRQDFLKGILDVLVLSLQKKQCFALQKIAFHFCYLESTVMHKLGPLNLEESVCHFGRE